MKDLIMDTQELENLIDREIEEYKAIETLYTEKKEILKKADSEALLNIDSKILDVVQNINNISIKRKEICEKFGIMTSSMSEITGFFKNTDIEASKRLETKKKEINELAKRIADLEQVNVELAKHGIEFTNKTLEAILKGVTFSSQEYNEKGKSVPGEPLEISSIIEEA